MINANPTLYILPHHALQNNLVGSFVFHFSFPVFRADILFPNDPVWPIRATLHNGPQTRIYQTDRKGFIIRRKLHIRRLLAN